MRFLVATVLVALFCGCVSHLTEKELGGEKDMLGVSTAENLLKIKKGVHTKDFVRLIMGEPLKEKDSNDFENTDDVFVVYFYKVNGVIWRIVLDPDLGDIVTQIDTDPWGMYDGDPSVDWNKKGGNE